MTMQDQVGDGRLEFDQADRMRRALRISGRSVQDVADELEVSRITVGAWINGRHKPRPRDLKSFALLTGFPYEWLKTGCAPRDLNPEPTVIGNRRVKGRRVIPIDWARSVRVPLAAA